LYSAATLCTHSSARMVSEIQVVMHSSISGGQASVPLLKTWTATMLAPGATPESMLERPAAVPATWVPWSQPTMCDGQYDAAPGPTCSSLPLGQRLSDVPGTVREKQASATTRPPRKGCEAS